jgi:hypothetical protein
MLALRSPATARAGSPRRWATGAVIAAILLADVPRAPDRTADRATDGATGRGAVHHRPPARALHRGPPPVAPDAPAAGGSAGPSHRTTLRHVIGL